MMRVPTFFAALAFLLFYSVAEDLELVREDRIKVFLYAAPAFWQEAGVDAYKNACVSLANQLIDGHVQSILIGGYDVVSVLQRNDDWYCTFYNNYNCTGNKDDMLVFGDGVNNLQSVEWDTEVHALRCSIENESYSED